MAKEILKIRIDNGLGDNNPTFKGIELDDYSGKFPRMGFPELTATLMWPTPLDDEWTHREYVVLRGEKFYVTDTPDAEKSNGTPLYKHDLGFTSEFARILGNTYFEDAVPSYSETYDKPCSNSSKFTFYGTISEFCDRLNCSFIKAGIADSVLKTKTSLSTLDTPVGDGYCVMLDPYGEGNVYDPNKTYEFSWEDKSHWEAITEGFNITEIPFERRGKCIIFGAIPKVVDHKFEYGHDNELLSVKHKNAKAKVVTRITMLGSSENIPYYYPNETEYGHISIAAKSGNNVLRDSNIQIVNMTQLLSRLNADSFAVLGKYDGIDVGNAETEQYLYSSAFDNGGFYNYILGSTERHDSNTTHNTYTLWHVRVFFKVTQSGVVECRNIRGNVWKQNDASPVDGADLIEGITPEFLKTVEDQSLGINSVDYSSQIERGEGYVSLGRLAIGKYYFQFSIKIQNKGAGRGEPITSWCKLTSIDIAPAAKQKTGYYWDVDGKKYDGVGALGVKIVGYNITDAMIGDGFGWVASGHMPFQDHLVPPKYRNTLGTERFYNALNAPYSEAYASAHPDAYIDPDTNNPYAFPNPFVAGAPSEHIFRDDDRKPTIEGVTNASGQLMGVIADIAYDADDNDALKAESTGDGDKNDTLKYEHSFFYIKLNIFNGQYGFDLFAHASQTDAMTIQMREGSCNGCKFKIQSVKFTDETGLETYKNPIIVQGGKAVGVVSEDGIKESDLDPAQQNTQTHSIWICVQKDAETFGVIMPNQSNKFLPKIGDKFNIINIDLPQGYILAAEKRLEKDGMRYMADNNEEKFSFDIQASRIFFAENPDVLAQLDEYSVIKVKYNGRIYEQYVNQLSIDCKSNEPLPNIGIDLTDTLAVGQSFVEQVAERASSLIANPYTMGGALGGSGGGLTTRLADQRYLKKTEADRSKGKVASDIGFEVGEFVSGGSGAILYQDPETGQTYLEVDKIKARMKAIFAELEVAKEQSIGGKFDITPGGGIDISFVEETATTYRCYFKAKDEDKGADCRFVAGDQARCQESNIANGTTQDASNRYYWRLVTEVNNNESYIELSKTDRDTGSDAPMAGDTVVQLGNRNNPERQSAIVLSTVDAYAPCVTLYNGIDHYSLDGKAVVEYGVDKTKNPPEPFFNCYGRFFFGPKGGNSYLKFEPSVGKLIFSGELINITSLNGKDIDKYITDLIPEPDLSEYDYLKEAIKDGASVTKGGLYLGGLIMLGQWDTSDEENPVFLKSWSGINGIRNHDKTIATWWGGDMVDKYYNDSVTPRPNPLIDDYAQALIRMDGSGYLAGGNIRWDEYGAITFGAAGITIDLGDGKNNTLQGLGDSIASLTQAMLNLNNYMRPMTKDANGNLTPTTWEAINSGTVLFAVKSSVGFYSDEFISARGLNPFENQGQIGASALADLTDVLLSNPSAGQALVFNGSKWVNQAVQTTPPDLSPYALNSSLTAHTGNGTIHITSAERTLWNQAATNLSAILGSDTDNVINKYEEIVAFLDTYTEADTLAGLLSNKADKTTKISAGTGLTGGGTLASDRTLSLATSGVTAGTYTKLTVDAYGRATAGTTLSASDIPTLAISKISGLQSAIDGKVSKIGDTMTGALHFGADGFIDHIADTLVLGVGTSMEVAVTQSGMYPFEGGNAYLGMANRPWDIVFAKNAIVSEKVKIGDCEITWDADKGMLKFSKGIYSLESISARGANANAGGASGGLDWDEIEQKLTDNGYAKKSWVNSQGFLKSVAWGSVTDKPTWIGSSKPSYAFSELTSHPTTLAGYGITDAKIANGVITLGGNTITPITSHQSLAGYATTSSLAYYLRVDGSNGTQGGVSALIHKLTEVAGDLTDATMLVTSNNADPVADTYYYRRSAIHLWNYVKGKADGVYQPKGSYLTAITKAQVEAVLTGNITSHTHSYLPLAGGTMTGALIMTTAATSPAASTNTALSYGRLQAYGTLNINANTDNSGTEYVNITAGHGLSNSTADGLSIGTDTLTWKDNVVLHSGNISSYAITSHQSLERCLYAFSAVEFDPATYDGYYAGMTTKSGIDTNWWHILSMNWGTTNTIGNKTWASQLALPTETRRGLRYRTGTSATAYSAWVTVIDSSNIGSYAITSHQSLANYVDKTSAQTISGAKTFTSCLTLKAQTSPDPSYASGSLPRIRFDNVDSTQNIALVFTDYDSYRSPAGLKLVGNQGNEWFEAPQFIRTGGTSSQFLKADGSVDSTAYLPKSGGTLTGTLNVATGLGISDATGNGLLVYKPTNWTGVANTQWGVGAIDIQGVIRSNNSSLIHYRNGVGNSTIWDSGNDGSGSGLDADLLDGAHNGELTAQCLNIVGGLSDFNATLSANGIYSWGNNIPNQPNSYGAMLQWSNVNNPTGGASQHWITQLASSTNNRLYYRTRTNGLNWNNWSTIAFTTDNVASATKLLNTRTIWGQNFNGEGNVDGTLLLSLNNSWLTPSRLRLGRSDTTVYTDRACIGVTDGNLHIDPYDGKKLYFNYYTGTGITPARAVIIDSDGHMGIGVSPSYKLDVNGVIRSRGEVISTYANGFRIANGSYGFFIRNDGDNSYFMLTAKNDIYGSWSTLRPLYINNANGLVTMGNGLSSPKGQFNTTTSTYALNTASFICDSWVRTSGATGWYSETYGGGWYMNETTWVRTCNNKGVYSGTGVIRSDNYFDRQGYGGTSWNSGYGAYNVAITNNNSQTPLMVAYRAGQTPAVTGDNRLFALELLNNGYQLQFAFKGVKKFHMNSDGIFYGAGGIYSDGYVSARGQNSSDVRLKEQIRDFNATDIIKTLHPVAFKWNALAKSKFEVFRTDEIQYGLIAQETDKVAPWLVDRNMFNDGLWGVKYEKLIPVLAQGQKEQIFRIDNLLVSVKSHEERIADLERENKELKRKIEILERR